MTPEEVAKDIAKQITASLEPLLAAALTKAKKQWSAEAEKALEGRMREWVQSAPIPVSVPFTLTADPAPKPQTDEAGRAIRGAVPKAVEEVMKRTPGLRTPDVEIAAKQIDSTIAIKSVANELSRGKDTKYRRDDEGRWWPV